MMPEDGPAFVCGARRRHASISSGPWVGCARLSFIRPMEFEHSGWARSGGVVHFTCASQF